MGRAHRRNFARCGLWNTFYNFRGAETVANIDTGVGALDGAFAPVAPIETVPTFDPVAEAVSAVADAGAIQGGNQAPESVVAESAPEPAPVPEAAVEDAPAAPEDPIAG